MVLVFRSSWLADNKPKNFHAFLYFVSFIIFHVIKFVFVLLMFTYMCIYIHICIYLWLLCLVFFLFSVPDFWEVKSSDHIYSALICIFHLLDWSELTYVWIFRARSSVFFLRESGGVVGGIVTMDPRSTHFLRFLASFHFLWHKFDVIKVEIHIKPCCWGAFFWTRFLVSDLSSKWSCSRVLKIWMFFCTYC